MLAVAGELSWLSFVIPGALFLIPLTRFPGFVWLIATGIALPNTIAGSAQRAVESVHPGQAA